MDVAHLARLLAFLSAPAEQTTSASQCRPLTWQQNLDDVTSSFSSDVAPPPLTCSWSPPCVRVRTVERFEIGADRPQVWSRPVFARTKGRRCCISLFMSTRVSVFLLLRQHACNASAWMARYAKRICFVKRNLIHCKLLISVRACLKACMKADLLSRSTLRSPAESHRRTGCCCCRFEDVPSSELPPPDTLQKSLDSWRRFKLAFQHVCGLW